MIAGEDTVSISRRAALKKEIESLLDSKRGTSGATMLSNSCYCCVVRQPGGAFSTLISLRKRGRTLPITVREASYALELNKSILEALSSYIFEVPHASKPRNSFRCDAKKDG